MTGFCPYITFKGNCETALRFYEQCFDGAIVFIQYYNPVASENKETSGVMHSEFRAEAVHFMACDWSPGQAVHHGTNISLYISFKSAENQEKVFLKLSEDGQIHMPLEKTVWGSRLGIVTDQFGLHWMLLLEDA